MAAIVWFEDKNWLLMVKDESSIYDLFYEVEELLEQWP